MEQAVRVASDGTGPVAAPRRLDGGWYHYELIERDDRWRAYADDPAALVAELVPGYRNATEPQRAAARTDIAVQAQVLLQAQILAQLGVSGCIPADVEVLQGRRDQPPALRWWQSPVPLVLVEGFYEPDGELPRPAAVPPGRILWLDPRTDDSLLHSLHDSGIVVLATRA